MKSCDFYNYLLCYSVTILACIFIYLILFFFFAFH